MWGLTEAELEKLSANFGKAHTKLGFAFIIVQTQLRHVWEEGEKPCPHCVEDFVGDDFTGSGSSIIATRYLKHACGRCWDELRKEVGEK